MSESHPPVLPQSSAPAEPEQMNWLERQFANTSLIIVLFAGFCFAPIMLVLSAVTLFSTKHPKARRNATIIFVVSLVAVGLGVVRAILVVMSSP